MQDYRIQGSLVIDLGQCSTGWGVAQVQVANSKNTMQENSKSH